MKLVTYLLLPLTLISGLWIGSVLGYSFAEDEYANERIEQLYIDSAMEVKMYTKALHLIHENQITKASVFLCTLLHGSSIVIKTNEHLVSEEVRKGIGAEAQEKLQEYMLDTSHGQ